MKILTLTATSVLALMFCLMASARPTGAVNAPSTASSAAELYSRNCTSCHGRDGKAKGLKARAKGARDLTDGQWQDRVSDERIFNSINNGKGKMPAYGKKLSESDINSLVTYVRNLKK